MTYSDRFSVRSLASTLSICALMVFSAGAQAAVSIDTTQFSLRSQDVFDNMNDGPQGLELLSNENGVIRIRMTGLANNLSLQGQGFGGLAHQMYYGRFDVAMNSGFYLTGYSLSGTLNGTLVDPELPWGAYTNSPGYARNQARVNTQVITATGEELGARAFSSLNLNGQNGFNWGQVNVDPGSHFQLRVDSHAGIDYVPTDWVRDLGDMWISGSSPAYAAINITDPVLTLYTDQIPSPVPEADTWAMMLAGLGLCTWVARRRQRK